MLVPPKNRVGLHGFRGPVLPNQQLTPQNITARPIAVEESVSSPSESYVQHCVYVQVLHTDLHKGPLNHNFELPRGIDGQLHQNHGTAPQR